METFNPMQNKATNEEATEKAEKAFESGTDFDFQKKEEVFLNPENMPPVPASGHEKSQEVFLMHREFLQEMQGRLFDAAVRPHLTDGEIDILFGEETAEEIQAMKESGYLEVSGEKLRKPNSWWAKIIMSVEKDTKVPITPEMHAEQAADARRYRFSEEEEKKEKEKAAGLSPEQAVKLMEKYLEQRMSIVTRAVERMHEFIEKHPTLRKFLFPFLLIDALAGCAITPSMVNTGIYGVVNMAQTEIAAQQNIAQNDIYARNLAGRTIDYATQKGQSDYDIAMQNAGQAKIDSLAALGRSLGRVPTPAESAYIEAQYQSSVGQAEAQYRQTTGLSHAQAGQIMGGARAQQQTVQGYARATEKSTAVYTIGNIFMQGVQGAAQQIQYGGHW
jgi:hypothetical protein